MNNILTTLLCIILLASCSTQRQAVEHKTNTDKIIRVNDTTMIKDTLIIREHTNTHASNDTVFIEHVRTIYRGHDATNLNRKDSIILVRDTVTIRELTNGEQATANNSLWGALIVLALCIIVVAVVVKIKSKQR